MRFFQRRSTRIRLVQWVSVLAVAAMLLAGCGMPASLEEVPFLGQFFGEEIVPTPTPVPTPTATPEPTATPKPGETPVPATPTPIPTPQVTIPQGFTAVVDKDRGYSLAVPRGWTPLDLRSKQFQNMANTFGMAGQLGPLNDFLASPDGKSLGVLYITDLMKALSGGLPTALNVFVLDAPGQTPESAKALVEGAIQANSAMLGGVKIDNLDSGTVNNLSAVRATASANLASVGMNAEVFVKVVGLIANDKIYILTLLTQNADRGVKEPIFDQIIGTFRPE